jgi:hypothetical protein
MEADMKRWITIILMATTFGLIDAAACEMNYTLTSGDGTTVTVRPEQPIELELGSTYVLALEYYEDHRNCTVQPEETLLLLEGSRWRENRETQPLLLTAPIEWTSPKNRTNLALVEFTATSAGTFRLEIIRSCTREGYDGELVFVVG